MNPIMAGFHSEFFKWKRIPNESAVIEPDLVSNQCSQQGQSDKKPRIILFPTNQDIKLHESKNAWRPSFKVKHIPDENAVLEKFKKRVCGILNKLTPEKFEPLVAQLRDELGIATELKMKVAIHLIFEKAIDEPNFCVPYANMCKSLALLCVPLESSGKMVQFRKLLLSKCQYEFEKEDEPKIRTRQLGCIRFIGELFKIGMLIAPIIHACIRKMLLKGDEDSLECVALLIKTVGKELEERHSTNPRDLPNLMDQYIGLMQKIVNRRMTSTRIRFILQDVIDLKKDNWIPRRDENNPKTIYQIHKEAEKESREAQWVYKNMSYSNKCPPDDRRKLAGRNVGVSEHGWKVLTSKRNKGSYNTVDPSKLKLDEPLRSFQLSVYSVEVNPQLRTKLIGHGEAIVRKIRLDHNVIINFSKREERMITIIGYENDAKAARYALVKLVQEQEDMYMEEVQIDSHFHSRITGFSGRNILKLMDQFKVDIRFPHPSDPEPDLVIIQGAKEHVLYAKDKLLNLVKEYLEDIKQQDLIRVGKTAGFSTKTQRNWFHFYVDSFMLLMAFLGLWNTRLFYPSYLSFILFSLYVLNNIQCIQVMFTAGFSTKTQCNWFHVYADSFMLLMAFLGLWNLTGFFYPSFLSFILICLYVLNNIQCIQVMFTAGFSTKTQCNWFHFYVDSFMLLMAFLGLWNLTRFFYHPLLSLILISLYVLNNIQYIQVMFIH